MYSAQNKYKKLQKSPNRLIFSSGFTIIEMIIVIIIMFIIFGVGTAGYRSFQRRKVIDGAVNQVVSHLRLAQEMALSGVKPPDCITLNSSLVNVKFDVTTNTTYSILGHCSDNSDHSYGGGIYDLDPDYPDIEFSSTPEITFNVLGRGVESAVTITLEQASSSEIRDIIITEGGEINVN